ncbi:MAG TPA: hypothetical protein VNA30_00815 [Mycobacteriales bacterium]|nr:hypothetical protein [Mycobacteriales bacterium]
MKLATRRRLAVGVLATASAVVGGFLVAPAALAGTVSVSPNFARNDEATKELIFTTQASFALGGDGSFTHTRAASSTVNFTIPPSPTNMRAPRATVNFTDGGAGIGADGPADAGLYNLRVDSDDPNPPLGGSDSCASCFTVIPIGEPIITGATPNSINQGSSNNITFNGANFERNTRIDVLLTTGQVDPTVFANGTPLNGTTPITENITTRNTMQRRVTASSSSPTGPRGLRVTNVDGSTAECQNCFQINGAPLTGVRPTAGSNDPDANPALTSITFDGTRIEPGTPKLVFVGANSGSASKASGELDIVGVNAVFSPSGTSVTADFDLRNAAPGASAYQPTVTAANNSVQACGCTFTIVQPRPPTVSSLDRDPQTAGNQKSQSAGSTAVYTVLGTNFSKGVRIVVGGTGVETTRVEFISPVEVRATIFASSTATPGDRDVTAVTTDGQTSGPCTACLTITAAGSPTASNTASATPTATTFTPQGNSRYAALASPVRVLDSRTGNGTSRGLKRGEVVLDLSGQITGQASAAVLNVTVTNPTATGFLVAYPAGNSRPGTSNVNFVRNQTQANEVIVGVPDTKRVVLYVDSASAHVIADLVGYFTTANVADAGRITTQRPSRVLDSRAATNVGTSPGAKRGEVIVDLTGRVQPGTTSVALNVTVQGPTARGFVVVYPTGTTRPGTSNVNFERGQTQANEVVTRLGTGANANRVSLFVDSASTALIADLVASIGPTASTNTQVFTPLGQPARVMDSRDGTGTPAGRKSGEVVLTLPSFVPAAATGVVLNVTTTSSIGPGHVAVYEAGTSNPGTSNVNFRSGINQANEVLTSMDANNRVTLFVGGRNNPTTHLVVDVVGYLTTDGASPAPSGSATATTTTTATATATATSTVTPTASVTPTATASATASVTPTGTATRTP